MQEFGINSPFKETFSISSHAPLLSASRETCHKCSTYSKYYCYSCMSLMPSISINDIPLIVFPMNIIIWKHPLEDIAKSTCVHAFILSRHSKISLFQHHPTFDPISKLKDNVSNPESTIIIYPSENALPIDEYDLRSYNSVLFIEATWNQSKTMLNSICNEFPDIRVAKLSNSKYLYGDNTHFWRYQNNGKFFLSTIEAIYLYCKQIDPATNYDNVLYFFSFQYHLIQEEYSKARRSFSYKHRLGQGYIK